MASPPPPPPPPMQLFNPRSGFCSATKTFRSLRPAVPLPPESEPLSAAAYALSLLPSPLPSNPTLVDAATAHSIPYPDFLSRVRALAANLRANAGLARGDVAFVLSPTLTDIPILYFALLSIGAVVSPANPLSSAAEIAHQFELARPAVAFVVHDCAGKLPPGVPTVVIDSPRFQSFLSYDGPAPPQEAVRQSDTAAVLYSSGTTGRVKGAALSHRNFIALIAGYHASSSEVETAEEGPAVALFTIPLFHVFGFFMVLRSVALGETMVLMGRFDFGEMLRAVETHRVTLIPVSPPLVVAMAKSDEASRSDFSSLRFLVCGGAPLGREVALHFAARFPAVEIVQGYGLTESTGRASSTNGQAENRVYGSVGRIGANLEAKIVDPATGEALPPGMQGELWLRGPTIMKAVEPPRTVEHKALVASFMGSTMALHERGNVDIFRPLDAMSGRFLSIRGYWLGYIGDPEATASTLDSDGWLKTGDLCYFDQDGFLFIVDRLKELIKYKAYQVPPAELEHILHSHPEIADAAVIPLPDEEAGQIPMAYVVRRPGSTLSEEDVIDFVAKQVAPYKKVRRVAFINSIPKNPAGKILRRELINHAVSSPKSKL